MSVARVFHPVASNTLLAVIIFAKNEATSCRPLEYLLQYSLRNLYLEKIIMIRGGFSKMEQALGINQLQFFLAVLY